MKAPRLSLLVSTVALCSVAFAGDEAKPADTVMAEAFATAKKEKKTVFLSFHASWCGWCHKLEDFLKIPKVKEVWDKRFVTVWLTVLESPDKKADENPGGDAWLKKVGGDNQGIPYMAFFNGNGEMLVTSDRPADKANAKDRGGNTGYPAAPEEIGWFMTMLEKGAKNVTPAERAMIKKALEEEAKKIKH